MSKPKKTRTKKNDEGKITIGKMNDNDDPNIAMREVIIGHPNDFDPKTGTFSKTITLHCNAKCDACREKLRSYSASHTKQYPPDSFPHV